MAYLDNDTYVDSFGLSPKQQKSALYMFKVLFEGLHLSEIPETYKDMDFYLNLYKYGGVSMEEIPPKYKPDIYLNLVLDNFMKLSEVPDNDRDQRLYYNLLLDNFITLSEVPKEMKNNLLYRHLIAQGYTKDIPYKYIKKYKYR